MKFTPETNAPRPVVYNGTQFRSGKGRALTRSPQRGTTDLHRPEFRTSGNWTGQRRNFNDHLQITEHHRFKVRRDFDGTVVVFSRKGQIYEYDDDELAVMFILPTANAPRPRTWGNVRRKDENIRDSSSAEGLCYLIPGDS